MQVNLTIKGYVQGVFFRTHAQEKANSLGLTGWIKNNSDGTVSASIQGREQTIQEFIDWCKKGPSSAKVESANIKWVDNPKDKFERFEIRY